MSCRCRRRCRRFADDFLFSLSLFALTYFFLLKEHFSENMLGINLMGQTQIDTDTCRLFECIRL